MQHSFDRSRFFNSYGQQFGNPSATAQQGLTTLLDQLDSDTDNWDNLNQIAYGFATFKWETANTFQPIHERGPVSYFAKYDPGTSIGERLGNTEPGDGYLFRGRGYVQLTGRANYTKNGGLLSIDLVGDPDLALRPDVAYRIAARGMRDGWFTGRKLSDYMPTIGTSDFVNARKIINGLDHAEDIAGIARKFQLVLNVSQITPVPGTTVAAT